MLVVAANGVVAQTGQKENISDKAMKAVSGYFTQNRHLTGFDVPLKTSGEFFLVPDMGLAWIVKKPFKSRLLMTDEGITQITHGSVMKVGGGGIGKIIAGMMYPALARDWPKLEQAFDIEKKPAVKLENNWQVTLHPRAGQMKKIISKIVVKGRSITEFLLVVKASGDRDEITFFDQKTWDETPVIAIDAFNVPADK